MVSSKTGYRLVQIGEFIEVEDDQTDLRQPPRPGIDVASLQVRNICLVSGKILLELIGPAGLLGHHRALDLLRKS